MPNSLRVRLKKLHYQGILSDKDLERLLRALDLADNEKRPELDDFSRELWDIAEKEREVG